MGHRGKTAPRMDPNPIPPQASTLDYVVTSSSDPETTSGLGTTSKWEASPPAGHTSRWQTRAQGVRLPTGQPWSQGGVSARSTPGTWRSAPAEGSPTSEVAWAKGKRKQVGGGHISFWGFSKRKNHLSARVLACSF